MGTTLECGRLKFLTVLDEYSRACLSIEVERRMTSRDVLHELERLITLNRPLDFIRCDCQAPRGDNGSEFIAQATRRFLVEAGVGTLWLNPSASRLNTLFHWWPSLDE